MEHARLAPSSAERIHLCNGSAKMEALYPQEDTEAAREGGAVHWVGEYIHAEMTGAVTDLDGVPMVGDVAPNGVVLNIEMINAAWLWFETIMGHGGIGTVERTIRQPALHTDNWGTPDHWFYDHMARTLYVDDLKYGFRYVEVRNNWQLVNYAALILNSLGLMHGDDIQLTFTIVQPRSYHRDGPVRVWRTTVGAVRPLWQQLVLDFMAASDPNVAVTPHPDACRDCNARFDCEGDVAATLLAVDMAYKSEPLEMSPEALSREYRMLKQAESFIKSRREGIEQRVDMVTRLHQPVPFFRFESTPGRTVWADDAVSNGIIDVCAAFGVDASPTGVGLTPKQAIDAGVPRAVVQQFSKTKSGALVLVEDDGSHAAEIFKGINHG